MKTGRVAKALKLWGSLVVCCVALVDAVAAAVILTEGEILTLRDGRLVHGTITDFDEASGITLERADTGGLIRLKWEHLQSSEVKRIKAARGFTGEAPEAFLVDVVHLVLKNGTTESGLRVDEEREDFYTLRRRSGTDSFPKHYVQSVEPGRMNGLEIYAPNELYQVLQAARGLPLDALSHFNMAVACEGAGLYDRAGEHYAEVVRLDAGFKPELLVARLDRIAVKIEDAAETLILDDIRKLLYRRKFGVAADSARGFMLEYPESRQLGDATALAAEIQRRKQEHHARGMISDYYSLLEDRVQGLARDKELGLDVARETLEDFLHREVLSELGSSYELVEETVLGLWAERSGGSMRSHSYGTGTFILGKQKALDFGRTDDEDRQAAEPGDELDAEEEFADLVEQVKKQRARKAARRQSAGSTGLNLDDEGPTAEQWWERAESDDRYRWLMAYFAEFAEAVRVVETRGRPCRLCDSDGFLEGLNQDREPVRTTCPSCKGLKFERLVRYR